MKLRRTKIVPIFERPCIFPIVSSKSVQLFRSHRVSKFALFHWLGHWLFGLYNSLFYVRLYKLWYDHCWLEQLQLIHKLQPVSAAWHLPCIRIPELNASITLCPFYEVSICFRYGSYLFLRRPSLGKCTWLLLLLSPHNCDNFHCYVLCDWPVSRIQL